MAILSTNNATITIAIEGYAPLEVENFDPDSDMWAVAELQTADGEVTPDGVFNHWGINAPIEATLTLSGGSDSAKILQGIINNQQRSGNRLGYVPSVSVIVEHGATGKVETYVDGVMMSGRPGYSLGSQKFQPMPFTFKFARKA